MWFFFYIIFQIYTYIFSYTFYIQIFLLRLKSFHHKQIQISTAILIITKEGGGNLVEKLRAVLHCFDHLMLNYMESRSNFRAFLSEARVGKRQCGWMRFRSRHVLRFVWRTFFTIKAADSSSRFVDEVVKWSRDTRDSPTITEFSINFRLSFDFATRSLKRKWSIHRWDLKKIIQWVFLNFGIDKI